MLDSPAALESGDSFTDRSPPQARRCFIAICVSIHSAGPPRSPRKWRQIRRSQPPHPGTARSHSDLRKTSLHWASQEPTNAATVPQIAAPQGRRGLVLMCVGRHCAGPPRSSRRWRQLRGWQLPGRARSRFDPRGARLRWTSQELTKVATVAHLAAPGAVMPTLDPCKAPLRWVYQ